jgi:hypothetical protein
MPLGQNSNLKIGQIIYVLSNKAQKIIPAIVIEEMTVKTLDGNQISWKVSVGPTGKEKIIDSKRLDGELYESLDEIQGVLKNRLEDFIEQLVKEAETRANTWYGSKMKFVNNNNNEGKIDPDSLIDEEAPAASPASLLASSSAEKKKNTGVSKAQAAKEARNKLIAAMSEENPKMSGDIMDQEQIQLPDGQVVKVNIRT